MKFDFHTHTVFSDGVLIPAELVRRYRVKGMRGVVLTDHVDGTNYEFVLSHLKGVSELLSDDRIRVLPGVEITHVPPDEIPPLVREVRRAGARVVVVHGETITEPVAEGTNEAAIKAKVDVLAHPGLIEEELVRLAAANGVLLELTYRKGHSLANGRVASLALKYNALLCVNSDAHEPSDIEGPDFRRKVALASGLGEEEVRRIEKLMENTFEEWWKR